MKKSVKTIALILAITAAASSFAGCGKKQTEDDGKEVTLRWVMPDGSGKKDAPAVFEKFNEELKKYDGLGNVSVNIETIAPSEYSQKFMLMQTSGNLPDIAGTYTLVYVNEVMNDTFLPLRKLVEKNAPDIEKEIPEWVFDLVTVKGDYYVIPNYQMMPVGTFNWVGFTDDFEKYGNPEKMKETFWKNKYFTEECYDVIEEYLKNLKDNNKLNMGVATSSVWAWKGFESLSLPPYYVRWTDDKAEVVNVWETPEMKLLIDKAHDWYEKGYVRKDVLSANGSEDVGKRNGWDLWVVQAIKGTEEQQEEKYGYDLTFVPVQEKYIVQNSSAAGGNGILEECENPEKAIKFLELMYTKKGKDLYNLLVYGIEGTHYEKVSDDRIKPVDYSVEPSSDSAYGIAKWIAGNTENAFDTTGMMENYKDYIFNDLNKNAVKSNFAGFSVDTSNVSSKILQSNTIYSEYDKPLCTGAAANYESVYKEFMDKLKNAGSDDIKAEIQKQVDEFLKNKNK